MKLEIPSGANEIIHTLQNNGYEAFLCGGAVRDSILGRPIHDYDITTSATPDEMMEVFKDKRIIETGLQHGTITIVIDGEGYECTTYRIDGDYSDSRRPDSVTFTQNLKEDLKRRDFTINAMAYNDEVGLVDPFNGMEDIKYHKIRCVGRAEDRFSEDALRILRAIRFASQLGFVLEPDTDWNISKMYKNLENISIERINSEFCKIAASSDFCVQMVLYHEVFSLFIPEIKDMFGFQQNNPYHIYDVWNHTVHAVQAYECDLFHHFACSPCFLYKKAAKTFLSNAFAAFFTSPIIFFIRWNSVQFLCASLFLFFFHLSPDRIFRCCHCLQGHGKKLFKFPAQLLCTSFNDFS